MKKSFKKVLSATLCVLFVFCTCMSALAKNTYDDYEWGYNFEGVIKVERRKAKEIRIPRYVFDAEEYCIDSANNDIAIVADGKNETEISIVGVSVGATVITVTTYDDGHYDYNDYGDNGYFYDTIESHDYAVIVYDEYSCASNGKVTGVNVDDITTFTGRTGWVDRDIECEGDVSMFEIFLFEDNGCVILDNEGRFEAVNRGDADGILYVIDFNGNIVSDSFGIHVKNTLFKWIKDIFIYIFNLIFVKIYY